MSKQTSFAHQKRILSQFLSTLSSFDNEFKELIQKYEQSVIDLYEEQGLMEEIYDDYKNVYMQSLKTSLLELLSRIQEEDIPYIEKEIDFISSH